jgi:hypothetical protein
MAPKRPKMIRTLTDLTRYFDADTPSDLNRRLYKDTDCGASISILTDDGTWLHNRLNLDGWKTVRAIRAFTIQTIVEDSDAEVNSPPFVLPVAEAEVDAWIKEMEREAARLWDEAHDPEEEVQ